MSQNLEEVKQATDTAIEHAETNALAAWQGESQLNAILAVSVALRAIACAVRELARSNQTSSS